LDTQNSSQHNLLVDVFPFDRMEHLGLLEAWMHKHTESFNSDNAFFGSVAYISGKPVAMGFLLSVDYSQKIAIFDGLVSNPDAGKEERHKALEATIADVLYRAKEAGVTKVLAWCKEPNTYQRAMNAGFIDTKMTLLTKEL